MGAGIAGLFAHAGCNVSLVDLSEGLLQRGWRLLEMGQAALLDAGLREEGDAEADQKRITTTTRLDEACEGVDLLVEAISEDLDLKREMFGKFDKMCPAEAILATVKDGLGLVDYKFILDETTTTPDLVDQNILYAKLYVKPARSIEFIALDFIITGTGAEFPE